MDGSTHCFLQKLNNFLSLNSLFSFEYGTYHKFWWNGMRSQEIMLDQTREKNKHPNRSTNTTAIKPYKWMTEGQSAQTVYLKHNYWVLVGLWISTHSHMTRYVVLLSEWIMQFDALVLFILCSSMIAYHPEIHISSYKSLTPSPYVFACMRCAFLYSSIKT